MSQTDQLPDDEDYQDSNCHEEDDITKKKEGICDMIKQCDRKPLLKDKWFEKEDGENPTMNIRQEGSPLKPSRKTGPSSFARRISPPDLLVPFSSPPTEGELSDCCNATMWQTGGSPDQPLKPVSRWSSLETLEMDGDGSMDMESLCEIFPSKNQKGDDYDDDKECDGSVTTLGSEGTTHSRLSQSALESMLYAPPLSPIQPHVIQARTA